ncbi:hypothetical protein E4L96_19425 [Massilia arenosa]|uniref:DNA mismatch repair protein MutS n=1 Tax=Zemynaea arenosa TaxID=2561931 RepID=A0A4Y9RXI9_9BURK|nr:hypothetical protein [Massilia arenosa]TFW13682.1 hypothetical protein E4L96_19425 [Massilia arenosa]
MPHPLSFLSTRAAKAVRGLLDVPDHAPSDYPFAPSDIAALHRATLAGGAQVDEQTWQDLMLPDCLERIAPGARTSLFGRQWLYRALRRQDGRERGLYADARALNGDPTERERQRAALSCLRSADIEVYERIAEDGPPPVLPWARWVPVPPWLLLVSLASAPWFPVAWLGVFVALVALMWFNVAQHSTIELARRRGHALAMLLRAKVRLDGDKEAAALNRALSPGVLDLAPMTKDYREWVLLAKVKHYLRWRRRVHDNRAVLRAAYNRCARAEAVLALALYIEGERTCAAQEGELQLDAVRHPLLAAGLPVSLALHGKGMFISGRNGEGKSTLLRTVGLNVALARGLGFCHADAARVPALPVYASLRNDDSLLDGESLYVAELRRARELLAAPAGLYLIDEIFRGTNHLDSVSSAAAVLNELAARGPVLVSSHNVILAALMRHRLDAVCVERGRDTVELRPGVLTETNGVPLLGAAGLGGAVLANAQRVQGWLARYLADPAEAERVLAPPAQPLASTPLTAAPAAPA